VGAGLLLAALTGCGGAAVPAGAPLPAGAAAAITSAQPGAATAAVTGGPTDTRTTPSDSPAAAAGVVVAYFTEINAASRAGEVADVAAAALPGCQACALDIAVTRDLQQRGLRADANPYAVTAVTAGPRQGVAIIVTFTAATNTVGLLDPAGRPAGTLPGVPTRTGTAQLALTATGWLIQTLRYAARQP
jgi:hypothetical protein